ncbi:TPA: hypothetical protein ACSCYS_004309 [Aeromonas veronii]
MDRSAFETAVKQSLYGSVSDAASLFSLGVDGDYKHPDVQFAWWAFQMGGVREIDSVSPAKLEAVARAICSGCEENPDHKGDARGNKHRWQDYLHIARAAIAAMKDCPAEEDDTPYNE